ncbi:MAG: ABC transporter permease [Armatimonadota bacterium]|nr:ABC transporter permease [Armatimonadota bacterium]
MRLADLGYGLRRNPITIVGLVLLAGLMLVALLAPLLAPQDPYATNPARSLRPPGPGHLFGTDTFGHDIFSRVLHGARIDLMVAAGAVGLAMVLGGFLGAVAGYASGWLDDGIMRLMDMLQAFPNFILALGIAAALGPSLPNLIIAIGLTNLPIYARLVRSRLLSLRVSGFALAAASVGNPPWRVLFVHLLPNCLAPVFVQATLQSGWAILQAAGLSFIGLGVRVPTPEWGVMISMGVPQLTSGHWWVSFFPGLAIMVAVIAFNLVGDGLQDVLDPRRR